MRVMIFFPLLCAIPAFILSMLCLYAGSTPGFMEDYHIVQLNTSTLGQIIVNNNSSSTTSGSSTATATTSSATSTHTGKLGGLLPGVVSNVSDTLQNDLSGIEDDLADKLAQMLGIDQWYSMHLQDMCYGSYSPNSTASSTSLNISGCTSPTPMYHFDPADMIDSQLNLGSYHINLSSVGWNDTMSSNIQELYTAIDAVYALLCVGATFSAISMLACAVALVKRDHKKIINLNWLVSLVAGISLFLSAILTTVVTKKVVEKINDSGSSIGVEATKGPKFMALSWAAAVLMLASMITWIVTRRKLKKRQAQEYQDSKLRGESIRLSETSYTGQTTYPTYPERAAYPEPYPEQGGYPGQAITR